MCAKIYLCKCTCFTFVCAYENVVFNVKYIKNIF